jgi:hypothetical protein
MPDGVVSNLGLTAGAGFYANVGIRANTNYANTISSYRSNELIANLLYTINKAATDGGLAVSAGTLANLQAIGADVTGNYCPALGDSIPSNVTVNVANVGLSGLLTANAAVYLGSGNFRVFAQAFQTALGFASVTNQVILSVCNSSDYLGPTFTTMDDLISGDIARVTRAYDAFGADLRATGRLLSFEPLDLLGTPSALLSAIAQAGNMVNGTTPAVRAALIAEGLTDQDIADLVNENRQELFNPTGLTELEFDRLQKRAYPGLCAVTGADLTDVLTILEVTTANITSLCELLDPRKIFPTSFPALTINDVLIYNTDGTVNETAVLPELVPRGCENLAKILPSDQAAATRALQVALGQINSIALIDGAQLARILT